MRAPRFALFAALLGLGALALGACRGPAPPVSYYTLTTLAAPAPAVPTIICTAPVAKFDSYRPQ